jgi:hypothetical protein
MDSTFDGTIAMSRSELAEHAEPRTNWRRVLLVSLVTIALLGTGGWAVVRYVMQAIHPRRHLVEAFLYKHTNDPAHLEIQSVMFGPRWLDNGVQTQYVLVRVRDKNAVGARSYEDRILRIEEDQVVLHGEPERKLLAAAHTFNWSSDPDGPGSPRLP